MSAIVGWSAVSAFGIGAEALCTGLRSGSRPVDVLRDDTATRTIPDFDAREVLGRKNTRSMDRVTALAVTAARDLVCDSSARGFATVLGTTTGSADAMLRFTRSALAAERPYLVDPAEFPNTVMNRAASQIAIWHGLTGPNATIAGGRTAALRALRYATSLQRAGRACTVLCGGAEELSDTSVWLHRARGARQTVLGEGAALFRLEPAGADRLAGVRAVETALADSSDELSAVMARCLHRALDHAGVSAGDVSTVAPSTAGEPERSAIAAVFGHEAELIDCSALFGDTGAAASALQIAAALVLCGPGSLVAVSAVDDVGTAAVALLDVGPGGRSGGT